jgi:hypothetical protein
MSFYHRRAAAANRQGLSIVELMIAIAISLVVLVVMMQAFRRASTEIKKGRAMIEMASEMRGVGETFRRDLAHLTVSPRVWSLNSEPNGYLEIIEGPQDDATYPAAPVTYPGMSFFGDVDDVIAMTVRSGSKPFRGRWVDTTGTTQIVESYVAEIIWFVFNDNRDDALPNVVDMDDQAILYRRVLLVRPDLTITEVPANLDAYFRNNDISARPVGASIVANTLSDLTARENRFAHNQAAFPYLLDPADLANTTPADDRRIPTGEDIMLTNVAGFDIRVYSPNAPIKTPNDTQFLGPNDPNWTQPNYNPAPISMDGAYVDIGWGGVGNGIDDDGPGYDDDGDTAIDEADEVDEADESEYWFARRANPIPGLERTWDSWSPHYYYGAVGSNGLDDDGDGQVDEETENFDVGGVSYSAPFPHPIRGLQLTMRGIEKSTRNIRQVTITSNFVPE